MAARVGTRLAGYAMFLDVSHFERAAGAILPLRALHIGGLYGELLVNMLNCRFLTLGLDGYTYLMGTDKRISLSDNDVHVPDIFAQLGSGLSCVAPVAKEILHVLYASFFVSRFKMTKADALQAVLDGGNSEIHILNYGDDNVIHGYNKDIIIECYDWLARYLPMAVEDPPSFLGYTYPPFQLRSSSYILNEWEAEKPPRSRFRPYPFFGMVERDKVYRDQTVTNEVRTLQFKKYQLLERYGYTEELVNQAAQREAMQLSSLDALASHVNVLLGKEYLLTDEDKIKSLRYVGLGEVRVAEIMRQLLKGSNLYKQTY
jgi:hypothetical protein